MPAAHQNFLGGLFKNTDIRARPQRFSWSGGALVSQRILAPPEEDFSMSPWLRPRGGAKGREFMGGGAEGARGTFPTQNRQKMLGVPEPNSSILPGFRVGKAAGEGNWLFIGKINIYQSEESFLKSSNRWSTRRFFTGEF